MAKHAESTIPRILQSDELFVGALVGATIGMVANHLWADLRLAFMYIFFSYLIHILHTDAPLINHVNFRRTTYVACALAVFACAFYVLYMKDVGFQRLFEPVNPLNPMDNSLASRTLIAGLILLPIFRFMSTYIRTGLLATVLRKRHG